MELARARLPAPSADAAVIAAAVVGSAAIAAVFTLIAYQVSPFLLPIAVIAAAVIVLVFAVPWVGVALVFVAAPLELYSVALPTGAVSASEAILACIGVAYVARLAVRPDSVVKPSMRDAPYAILLLVASLGIAFAPDPAPVIRILVFWTLFYLVYLQVQSFDERQMRSVCWALAAGAGILGLVGALQFISAGGGGLYAGGAGTNVRAIGTFGAEAGDSNYYAGFLALAALPAIALIVANPRRTVLLVPLVAMAIAGLASSLSRGGMLGFAAGILLLLLWGRARWMAAGITLAVLVITVAGANPLVGSSELETVEQRLSTIGDTARTSTNTRPDLFAAAADLTVENPLTGVGLNQFQEHASRRGLTERGRPPETAHNVYLSLAAELGLIGVGAFVWFLVFIARRALISLRAQAPSSRALAFGAAASLFGFAIQGLTVSSNRHNLLWGTFLVIAGMLVALSDRVGRETVSAKA